MAIYIAVNIDGNDVPIETLALLATGTIIAGAQLSASAATSQVVSWLSRVGSTGGTYLSKFMQSMGGNILGWTGMATIPAATGMAMYDALKPYEEEGSAQTALSDSETFNVTLTKDGTIEVTKPTMPKAETDYTEQINNFIEQIQIIEKLAREGDPAKQKERMEQARVLKREMRKINKLQKNSKKP